MRIHGKRGEAHCKIVFCCPLRIGVKLWCGNGWPIQNKNRKYFFFKNVNSCIAHFCQRGLDISMEFRGIIGVNQSVFWEKCGKIFLRVFFQHPYSRIWLRFRGITWRWLPTCFRHSEKKVRNLKKVVRTSWGGFLGGKFKNNWKLRNVSDYSWLQLPRTVISLITNDFIDYSQ